LIPRAGFKGILHAVISLLRISYSVQLNGVAVLVENQIYCVFEVNRNIGGFRTDDKGDIAGDFYFGQFSCRRWWKPSYLSIPPP
jgi:hypothetical protein